MTNKEFFVYILECKDGSYYTGFAKDLKGRMEKHKSGKGSKYVRAKGFKGLVYFESYLDGSKALKREFEIKKLDRIGKEILIRGFDEDFDAFS
jgi:putative endonuclease